MHFLDCLKVKTPALMIGSQSAIGIENVFAMQSFTVSDISQTITDILQKWILINQTYDLPHLEYW